MEEKYVLVFSHSELSLMLTALDRLREDTKVERYQVQALHLGDAIQEILEPGTFDSFHPAKLAARAHRLVIPALLEQPQPEAREEDIDWNAIDDDFDHFLLGFPEDIDGERYERECAMQGGHWMKYLIKTALSRLAAKEGQGWISVKERLPEKTQYVLVYADGAMGCLVWNHEHSQWEDWTNQKIPNIARDFITHWMPLPAAPATSEKPVEEKR